MRRPDARADSALVLRLCCSSNQPTRLPASEQWLRDRTVLVRQSGHRLAAYQLCRHVRYLLMLAQSLFGAEFPARQAPVQVLWWELCSLVWTRWLYSDGVRWRLYGM